MLRLSESCCSIEFFSLGSLLTGLSILGLIFYKKIFNICSDKDPSITSFDYGSFFALILFLVAGFCFLLGFNTIKAYNLLTESIRFQENGNYFLGKLFWKCASMRRRPENNEINN